MKKRARLIILQCTSNALLYVYNVANVDVLYEHCKGQFFPFISEPSCSVNLQCNGSGDSEFTLCRADLSANLQ